MAEGLMKKLHGHEIYVQSAGVKGDREIDGFAIAVCEEVGVELSKHRSRSFEEMQEWGDDLEGFDLIVALTPASQRVAQELARNAFIAVEYWPIMDPSGLGETREAKLSRYREARDQIEARLRGRFP
jgi:arsenate reductase